MAGSNYCWSCGHKIPKGQVICDSCNADKEDQEEDTQEEDDD